MYMSPPLLSDLLLAAQESSPAVSHVLGCPPGSLVPGSAYSSMRRMPSGDGEVAFTSLLVAPSHAARREITRIW